MGARSNRQIAALGNADRLTISSLLYGLARWVNYVGFPDGAYYVLAEKYRGGRARSLRNFSAQGEFGDDQCFCDALKLIKRLVNLGDAKSLVCLPASTTHRQTPAADQIQAGVKPETIWQSDGAEHVDDIVADLYDAASRA